MSDDPTPRELLIQMQALVKQVESLALRVDSLADSLAERYVPKGEYLSDRRGDDRRFAELERDNANQSGFRRQVYAGLTVAVVVAVLGVLIALAQAGAGVPT